MLTQVTFELHHTFENPIRTVVEPPWEIQEHGWGEFDIGITVRVWAPTCVPAAGAALNRRLP